MTKDQEIQILIDTATKLGPDSYSGTWLKEQIPFIQLDIRSDHPVGTAAVSISEAKEMVIKSRETADKMLAETKKHCDRIIQEAKDQAWKRREDILYKTAKHLRECAQKLDSGYL